jgi:hypothetical protein
MATDLIQAHQGLWKWCRAHDFAGYDPYDALNSRLFQATPLKHSRIARLAWTQIFKRSPLNFRPLALVPSGRNPKCIALFALAALADYRRLQTIEAENEARELLDDLMAMSLKGFRGAAWGYNFDWQGRAFFAPRDTPTVVPTAFAARALVEGLAILNNDDYLRFARTACDFILNDLNRSDEARDEVCFSYSPLDRTRVFNASLLAAEVLASVGKLSKEESLSTWSMRVARYVIRRQHEDGSWSYGAGDHQSWSDNFHTAFVLTSLSRLIDALVTEPAADRGPQAGSPLGVVDATESFRQELEYSLRRGYDFWQERFFLSNGWPKYYPDRLYPADAHSAAAAIVALVELRGRIPGTMDLAQKIAHWAVENLYDRHGFFYYQRRRFHTVRVPYMRWSEGWMAYALARLLEAEERKAHAV